MSASTIDAIIYVASSVSPRKPGPRSIDLGPAELQQLGASQTGLREFLESRKLLVSIFAAIRVLFSTNPGALIQLARFAMRVQAFVSDTPDIRTEAGRAEWRAFVVDCLDALAIAATISKPTADDDFVQKIRNLVLTAGDDGKTVLDFMLEVIGGILPITGGEAEFSTVNYPQPAGSESALTAAGVNWNQILDIINMILNAIRWIMAARG